MRNCVFLLLLLCCSVVFAEGDSINKLSVGLDFMAHGETCGGGLPKSNIEQTTDKSHFLFGRTRLNLSYERRGLDAHAVIQNEAVWGMSGNQSVALYEGWVRLTSRNGLFAQIGRVALNEFLIGKLSGKSAYGAFRCLSGSNR